MNKEQQRLLILKIAAAGVVALFLLDKVAIEPGIASWNEQSKRIASLRTDVEKGDRLVGREQNLRDRWAGMVAVNPPANDSEAEDDAVKALARWELAARVFSTSVSKDRYWKHHVDDEHPDQSYDTLEFTISLNADQASIGRFLYEMENDKIPVSLDTCNITSRDARGTQLALQATFSFLRMPQAEGNTR